MAETGRSPARGREAVLLGVHAGLGIAAIVAWRSGPFGGHAVSHGAETLAAALAARPAPDPADGPLALAALGPVLRAGLDSGWAAGLWGLVCSVACLLAVGRLAAPLGPTARLWAVGFWAASGAVLGSLVQPGGTLQAEALLTWGLVAMNQARRGGGGRRAAVVAGVLLGAAVLTRWPLAIPVGLLLVMAAARRPWRPVWVGAGLAVLVALLVFGDQVLPRGLGLPVRLTQGPGATGLVPSLGPRFDRVRAEPWFQAHAVGAATVEADAFHLARVGRLWAAEPTGCVATLGRKATLFWRGEEVPVGADIAHGLSALPGFGLLLLVFAVVGPLALVDLSWRRDGLLLLTVLGGLLGHVVFVGGSEARLAYLPCLCVAAGATLAAWSSGRRPRRRLVPQALLAVAAAVLFNLPRWEPTPAVDGLAQEARLHLDRGEIDAALRAYELALAASSAPRLRFEAARAQERLAESSGRLESYVRAERLYREALRLEPAYPEPADHLMTLLVRQGRVEEATELGARVLRDSPHAGFARLYLAVARKSLEPSIVTWDLEEEGYRILALRHAAAGDRDAAAGFAGQLRRLGRPDPVLERMLSP